MKNCKCLYFYRASWTLSSQYQQGCQNERTPEIDTRHGKSAVAKCWGCLNLSFTHHPILFRDYVNCFYQGCASHRYWTNGSQMRRTLQGHSNWLARKLGTRATQFRSRQSGGRCRLYWTRKQVTSLIRPKIPRLVRPRTIQFVSVFTIDPWETSEKERAKFEAPKGWRII